MAKAYIIGMITVHDMENYKPYMAQTQALVQEYGGRYLVRGGNLHIAEGEMQHDRMVVIEFENSDQLNAFYDDPRYVDTRLIRQDNSEGTIIHVGGFEG